MLQYQRNSKSAFERQGEAMEEEYETEEPAEHAAEESIGAEHTKYKLEILNTIQDLKNIKEKTIKKCEDVLKLAEKMESEASSKRKSIINHPKPDIVQEAKELGINPDPTKKMKI
jgi:predicted MPP superfamily phosphohydrolase